MSFRASLSAARLTSRLVNGRSASSLPISSTRVARRLFAAFRSSGRTVVGASIWKDQGDWPPLAESHSTLGAAEASNIAQYTGCWIETCLTSRTG